MRHGAEEVEGDDRTKVDLQSKRTSMLAMPALEVVDWVLENQGGLHEPWLVAVQSGFVDISIDKKILIKTAQVSIDC